MNTTGYAYCPQYQYTYTARCGQTAACSKQISGLGRIQNGRSVQKYREIDNFEALKKIMRWAGKYHI